MTRDEADTIIDYIEVLEEKVRHEYVMRDMIAKGYNEREVDGALKAIGLIAGRDCGIL